jgi:hypothetical protein
MGVENGVSFLDVDTNFLSSARVYFASNFEAGDVLLCLSSAEIVAVYSDGLCTFSGRAHAVSYERALRSVAYSSESENPSASAKLVIFILDDGEQNSNVVQVSVIVTPVNDLPLFNPTASASFYVSERASKFSTFGDPIVAQDPDNKPLTYTVISIIGYIGTTASSFPADGTFSISEYSGQLSVVRQLDYESVVRYVVTVGCFEHLPATHPSSQRKVEVFVLDANDAVILSVRALPGSSYYVTSLLSKGGEQIEILGENLIVRWDSVSRPIVTYGPTGLEYTATKCLQVSILAV